MAGSRVEARTNTPRLPPELILQVIDSLVLSRSKVRWTSYDPKDILTRTLLSLAGTSRLTYAPSVRHLVDNCLYINSDVRLRQLLITIDHHHDNVQQPSVAPKIEPTLLPRIDFLANITSMYLEPFRGFYLDDLPTAVWIRELFYHCCGTLRRLVADIPFRALYPENDHLGIRDVLHEAFSQLNNLEEFVNVRDELYLDHGDPGSDPPVWSSWPKLRKLALYNVDTESVQFWDNLAKLEYLDTVVLTRADRLESFNPKTSWLARTKRPIKIVLVNVPHDHFWASPRDTWKREDPKDLVSVHRRDVSISYYGDEDPITVCQDWVRNNAIWGKLWTCSTGASRV